jgi:hypothetical protein
MGFVVDRVTLELFNEPDIAKYIKINRLGCAGHVIKAKQSRYTPWRLLGGEDV